MAPLSDPLTIRLPDDLLVHLDVLVRQGRYTNRSEAIRELLEAVTQAPPEPLEAATQAPPVSAPGSWFPYAPLPGIHVPSHPQESTPEIPGVPWFMIPLRSSDATDVFQSSTTVDFRADAMVAPETYVPFGVWSDDRDRAKFMVEDIKIGGGCDLLGDRPTPLSLAAESSWRNGFPSRLTIDPYYLDNQLGMYGSGLPICKYPNTTTVTLRRLTESPPSHASISDAVLGRRVMVWSAPERVVYEYDDAVGQARSEAAFQSAKGPVELLTVHELLRAAGFDLDGLRRVLGNPFGSLRTDPLRLAILAVRPEHREALIARMQMKSA